MGHPEQLKVSFISWLLPLLLFFWMVSSIQRSHCLQSYGALYDLQQLADI
jgi:hypothetical protein